MIELIAFDIEYVKVIHMSTRINLCHLHVLWTCPRVRECFGILVYLARVI
jgi:hypothetical protein